MHAARRFCSRPLPAPRYVEQLFTRQMGNFSQYSSWMDYNTAFFVSSVDKCALGNRGSPVVSGVFMSVEGNVEGNAGVSQKFSGRCCSPRELIPLRRRYLAAFEADAVPHLLFSWTAGASALFSLLVQIPGTQGVFELVGTSVRPSTRPAFETDPRAC